MNIYIIEIFVLMFFGIFVKSKKSQKWLSIYFFVSFLLLFVTSAFRGYYVGVDTRSYQKLFYNIDNIGIFSSRYEPGFLLLIKLIKRISNRTRLFLVVTSYICISSVFNFIKKHSREPIISILLYVLLRSYFSSMNSMRESLAISITLYAYSILLKEFSKKNIIRAYIIIGFSMMFHSSTVVSVIPLTIWIYRTINKKTISQPWIFFLKILLLSLFVFAIYDRIMNLAIRFFPQYSRYFYGKWSDSNYFASLLKTLISFVFMVVGLIFYKNKPLSKEDNLAYIMLSCSIVTEVLSMRMEIWSRISGVFTVFTFLLWVPELLNKVRIAKNRVILKTAIVVFSFAYLMIIFTYRPQWEGVIPYVFSWE